MKCSFTAPVRMAAMGIQTTTYAAAAIYTHSSATHHDVCGFYACVSACSLVSFLMTYLDEGNRQLAIKQPTQAGSSVEGMGTIERK